MTAPRRNRKWAARPLLVESLLAVVALVAITSWVTAATVRRVVVDERTGLAIHGYDPVAYFTENAATPGREELELPFAGAIWRFRNEGNRAVFLEHPEVYGPQFGGYDPIDIARGVAVAGDPRFWLISGQRLFLFGRPESRDAFAADPARLAGEARRRWPHLRETLAR